MFSYSTATVSQWCDILWYNYSKFVATGNSHLPFMRKLEYENRQKSQTEKFDISTSVAYLYTIFIVFYLQHICIVSTSWLYSIMKRWIKIRMKVECTSSFCFLAMLVTWNKSSSIFDCVESMSTDVRHKALFKGMNS